MLHNKTVRFFIALSVICVIPQIFWGVRHSDEITSPLGRGVYGQPVWSPDNSHLAFTYNSSGLDELWILDVTSRETVKVAATGYMDSYSGAAWQDSNTLWFIQDNALYKVDIKSNKPVPVMPSDDSWGWEGLTFQTITGNLVFAKRWITFTSQPYKPNDLYVFDTISKNVSQLTNTPDLNERAPVYSRDGKRLAYAAEDTSELDLEHGKKAKPGLNILEADNTVRRLDISVRNGANKLGWSPNSNYILSISDFDADGIYDPRLYLHRADGTGRARKITTDYDSDGLFGLGWSTDGSKVAFTTVGAPGRNELHVIPAAKIGLADVEYVK